jgi:hypothetical protein
MLTYLAVMCIFVVYKCLSGGDQQQDLGKPSQKLLPSQTIDRKLLSVVGEKTLLGEESNDGLVCCIAANVWLFKYVLHTYEASVN